MAGDSYFVFEVGGLRDRVIRKTHRCSCGLESLTWKRMRLSYCPQNQRSS